MQRPEALAVLGLQDGASEAEIKTAYKKMALRWCGPTAPLLLRCCWAAGVFRVALAVAGERAASQRAAPRHRLPNCPGQHRHHAGGLATRGAVCSPPYPRRPQLARMRGRDPASAARAPEPYERAAARFIQNVQRRVLRPSSPLPRPRPQAPGQGE
jgi:hypothetical protein